jgi:hypothetical protein
VIEMREPENEKTIFCGCGPCRSVATNPPCGLCKIPLCEACRENSELEGDGYFCAKCYELEEAEKLKKVGWTPEDQPLPVKRVVLTEDDEIVRVKDKLRELLDPMAVTHAEIARLNEELADLRSEFASREAKHKADYDSAIRSLNVTLSERDALKALADQQRGVVRYFGQHFDWCKAVEQAKEWSKGAQPTKIHMDCTCGLSHVICGKPLPAQALKYMEMALDSYRVLDPIVEDW